MNARRTRRPGRGSATAEPQWVSRRVLCALLLVLAAAIAGAYWVEIVTDTLDRPDVGAASIEPEFFRYTEGHNFDFYQYYAAGHNWSLGLDPYTNHPDDPRVLPHPRHEDKSISGWIYPPASLPVFAALADLSYNSARYVWFAITLGFLAASMAIAVLVTPGRRLEILTGCVLLTVCSYPLLFHVHQGQIDLVVGGLTVSAFLLYPRWRGWPSAALLAAAILLKLTPALLLVVMVLYFRDVRFLVKTLVCLVTGVALSLLAISPGLYWEYVTNILPRMSATDPSRFNQTLVRFWSGFPVMARALSAFGYLAALFLAYVSGRNRLRIPEADRVVEPQTEGRAILLFALLMTLMFSPLAWQMAYAMTIVPVAVLLVASPPRTAPWAPVGLVVGAAFMSSKIYDVQVLNLLNVLGAGIAVLCLIRYYLPLSTAEASSLEG